MLRLKEFFDSQEKAEIAKEEAEKELADAGYENISSEITEVKGEAIKYTFSGTYDTKEEAEKSLNDFAKDKNGNVTDSKITENNNMTETVYEEKTEIIDGSTEDYVAALNKKIEELNKHGDYRLEIADPKTITSEKVVIVIGSVDKDTKVFGTRAEADAYIASLGTSTEMRIVEATLTSKEELDKIISESVNKTFDSKLEAEQYIESLKAAGYDVSDLELVLSTFEESIWKNEDGVIVKPGDADGSTFKYGHFDVTLITITSFAKIDAEGNKTTVTGTITISSVKINDTSVAMSGLSKDPNNGLYEYTSIERNRLDVTNKSLVEITGNVIYNGKSLPFTVKGYLSESQNVCDGKGNAKGYDLKFESVTIVNNKVYVDSNIVEQYKVSGDIKKETYKTVYTVDSSITNMVEERVPVNKTQMSYKIYKQTYSKSYTIDGTVQTPTKDYKVSGEYKIPTKDYELAGTYEIPTTNYLLNVRGERMIVPEVVVDKTNVKIVTDKSEFNTLAQTGDDANVAIPAGLAGVALGTAFVASRAKRRTLRKN